MIDTAARKMLTRGGKNILVIGAESTQVTFILSIGSAKQLLPKLLTHLSTNPVQIFHQDLVASHINAEIVEMTLVVSRFRF